MGMLEDKLNITLGIEEDIEFEEGRTFQQLQGDITYPSGTEKAKIYAPHINPFTHELWKETDPQWPEWRAAGAAWTPWEIFMALEDADIFDSIARQEVPEAAEDAAGALREWFIDGITLGGRGKKRPSLLSQDSSWEMISKAQAGEEVDPPAPFTAFIRQRLRYAARELRSTKAQHGVMYVPKSVKVSIASLSQPIAGAEGEGETLAARIPGKAEDPAEVAAKREQYEIALERAKEMVDTLHPIEKFVWDLTFGTDFTKIVGYLIQTVMPEVDVGEAERVEPTKEVKVQMGGKFGRKFGRRLAEMGFVTEGSHAIAWKIDTTPDLYKIFLETKIAEGKYGILTPHFRQKTAATLVGRPVSNEPGWGAGEVAIDIKQVKGVPRMMPPTHTYVTLTNRGISLNVLDLKEQPHIQLGSRRKKGQVAYIEAYVAVKTSINNLQASALTKFDEFFPGMMEDSDPLANMVYEVIGYLREIVETDEKLTW